jgi:hypothetical protein
MDSYHRTAGGGRDRPPGNRNYHRLLQASRGGSRQLIGMLPSPLHLNKNVVDGLLR